MSRIKKLFLALCIVMLVADIILYVYMPIVFWAIVNISVIICIIGLFAINKMLKKTYWYKDMFVDYDNEIYPNNHWYRKHEERNFDVVALGSSGAKYAYDFTEFDIKGMNWAQQPQTLLDDFKLLKTFHSILRKEGHVLINIMPFTSCNKETGFRDTYRYLNTYYEQRYFDQRFYKKAFWHKQYPILFGKTALIAFARYILRNDRTCKSHPSEQKMSAEQLRANAKKFITGWKHQFGIDDFESPLTEQNKKGRAIRLQVMREMIDFIVERNYVPVFVIPPVTEHLSAYYTETFVETYIYSFMKELDRDVKLLDYSNKKDLKNDNLYFNSFFLNKKGARIFTKRVLEDLNLI